MNLKPKDKKILRIITKNCKLSTREISEKINIPITTIHNRIQRMEKDGIIQKYIAVLDEKKLGNQIQAYIELTMDYKANEDESSLENVSEQIVGMKEVKEAHVISGTPSLLIKVSVKNVDQLHNFVTKKLRNIPCIRDTKTGIILKDLNGV